MIQSSEYYAPFTVTARLAFKECGLSLGLNVLHNRNTEYQNKTNINFEKLENYHPLADVIEKFWLNATNKKTSTWVDHLNINAVTLACSMSGEHKPEVLV